MSENPYSSSIVELKSEKTTDEPKSLSEIARTTFLAWEKLRLAYIGIVGVWTLLFTFGDLFRPDVIIPVVFGGFIANVLYFAAPLLETYVRWLGYNGKSLRIVLFVMGTLITMILVLLTLAPLLLPTPN